MSPPPFPPSPLSASKAGSTGSQKARDIRPYRGPCNAGTVYCLASGATDNHPSQPSGGGPRALCGGWAREAHASKEATGADVAVLAARRHLLDTYLYCSMDLISPWERAATDSSE